MLILINIFCVGFMVDLEKFECEVGKMIVCYEFYDELDVSDKVEVWMFELLIEQDKDDVLKVIGWIVWDVFFCVVKCEIDMMNEQIVVDMVCDCVEV